jgi:hypothetical protein
VSTLCRISFNRPPNWLSESDAELPESGTHKRIPARGRGRTDSARRIRPRHCDGASAPRALRLSRNVGQAPQREAPDAQGNEASRLGRRANRPPARTGCPGTAAASAKARPHAAARLRPNAPGQHVRNDRRRPSSRATADQISNPHQPNERVYQESLSEGVYEGLSKLSQRRWPPRRRRREFLPWRHDAGL